MGNAGIIYENINKEDFYYFRCVVYLDTAATASQQQKEKS